MKSISNANNDLEQCLLQCSARLDEMKTELESFSYAVSHDLKAPLRAIHGFAEIFVKRYADKVDATGRQMVSSIVTNVEKMGRLIDSLLEYSRVGSMEMEMRIIPMNELVDAVIEELQDEIGMRGITVHVDALGDVSGDEPLLKVAWTHLISNAIKFTNRDNGRIHIGSFTRDGERVFFVSDNGVGFDPAYTDKLFKVFQRLHGSREFQGAGLGLAVVGRIIARHKGNVWAEGKENEGAAFYFSLPSALPGKAIDNKTQSL